MSKPQLLNSVINPVNKPGINNVPSQKEQPMIEHSNPVAVVHGDNLSAVIGNETLKNVYTLKIVALDEEGNELSSYDTNGITINLTIDATNTTHIEGIALDTGFLTINRSGPIDNISTFNGIITIEKVNGNVSKVSSGIGAIHIQAYNVITATTISGNIIKEERNPRRDRSPHRHDN